MTSSPEDAHKRYRMAFVLVLTLVVCLASLSISLVAPPRIFDLVLFAWSGLGCAFTPLLLIYVFKRPITEFQALTMIFLGLVTAVLWRVYELDDMLYEGLPAMALSFLGYFVLTFFRRYSESKLVS